VRNEGRVRRILLAAAVVVVMVGIAAVVGPRATAAGPDPTAFSPLPPLPVPADNPITPEKVELGRLLYFDPRMSADGSLSCNSCHPADQGFAAPAPISFGPPGTSHWRNVMTIINTAYYTSFNWDGGKKRIEQQNAGAWGGAVAGNLDKALAEERLAQIPEYVRRFREVFGTPWPTWADALRAVASYERTFVSRNVPFDAYAAGDDSAISEDAKAGFALFVGKAGCAACHRGPVFTDDSFHNLGVPQNPEFATSPLRQITFRYEQWAKGTPEEVYRTATRDLGLYYVTKQDADKGKFRTVGLRDACYTAPYMHDGVFATLAEVVAFYDSGGEDVPNKDPLLHPLGLSAREQEQLVAFLESLCGDRLADTQPELPPYGELPEGGTTP